MVGVPRDVQEGRNPYPPCPDIDDLREDLKSLAVDQAKLAGKEDMSTYRQTQLEDHVTYLQRLLIGLLVSMALACLGLALTLTFTALR